MGEHKERRAHPRHPCDRTFEGQLSEPKPAPAGTFHCHAVNASEGGMMLETRTALRVGQHMELYLKARDNSRSFVAQAEVMWTEVYGAVWRSGVKFLRRHEEYVV